MSDNERGPSWTEDRDLNFKQEWSSKIGHVFCSSDRHVESQSMSLYLPEFQTI